MKTQQWANDRGLFGKVSGGVIIPNKVTGAAAVVWNSQNKAPVVATERSTFLG